MNTIYWWQDMIFKVFLQIGVQTLWQSLILPLAFVIKVHYRHLKEIQLEAQWAEPVSLTFHSALRKLNTEPSIGASHQISVHFGKAVSEKKIFRNQPI
jgi:hypothetical protein